MHDDDKDGGQHMMLCTLKWKMMISLFVWLCVVWVKSMVIHAPGLVMVMHASSLWSSRWCFVTYGVPKGDVHVHTPTPTHIHIHNKTQMHTCHENTHIHVCTITPIVTSSHHTPSNTMPAHLATPWHVTNTLTTWAATPLLPPLLSPTH